MSLRINDIVWEVLVLVGCSSKQSRRISSYSTKCAIVFVFVPIYSAFSQVMVEVLSWLLSEAHLSMRLHIQWSWPCHCPLSLESCISPLCYIISFKTCCVALHLKTKYLCKPVDSLPSSLFQKENQNYLYSLSPFPHLPFSIEPSTVKLPSPPTHGYCFASISSDFSVAISNDFFLS